MFPNQRSGVPAGKKKEFNKDQTSYDTERSLLGKPQKYGAALPEDGDDPGSGNIGAPGGKHPQTEPEGGELPNNTGSEVPSKAEDNQAALPAKPGMEGQGAEGEYAPTQPTLPAVASKMDELCEDLRAIKTHLGLNKDDQEAGKPGAAPAAMGNDDEGEHEGFGGY